jgi:hypothetical protein
LVSKHPKCSQFGTVAKENACHKIFNINRSEKIPGKIEVSDLDLPSAAGLALGGLED